MEWVKLIIQLSFELIIIFSLMYLVVKISGKKLEKINQNKYITVIERTNISKETAILLLKVGEKGYLVAVNNNNIEKLEEISKEEMTNIINEKKKNKEAIAKSYEGFTNNILIKIKKLSSKED